MVVSYPNEVLAGVMTCVAHAFGETLHGAELQVRFGGSGSNTSSVASPHCGSVPVVQFTVSWFGMAIVHIATQMM